MDYFLNFAAYTTVISELVLEDDKQDYWIELF